MLALPSRLAILATLLLSVPLLAATPPAPSAFDRLPDIKPLLRDYKPGLQARIFLPPGLDPKTDHRPTLFFIHGGGWGAGKADSWDPHCRYYAAHGLVAITVEYRLTNAAGTLTIFDCLADVKTALRWVRSHAAELGVDAEKVVAVGDSAGGHLAACTGLIAGLEAPGQDLAISSRPNAMVLFYPVIGLTPPDGWDLVRFSGKSGKAVLPRAKEISPIDQVKKDAPPTLVLQGTVDKLTPLAPAERFVTLMKQAGNRVEMERFEGQDHAFMTVGYGTDAIIFKGLARMDEFLKTLEYLPKDPQP